MVWCIKFRQKYWALKALFTSNQEGKRKITIHAFLLNFLKNGLPYLKR